MIEHVVAWILKWLFKKPFLKDDLFKFRNISVPLVRRVYPSTIAQKITPVQPLKDPTAMIYYLKFKHGKKKND